MESLDEIFRELSPKRPGAATVIVCFYTGSALPSSCAPMLRRPLPDVGMTFDGSFPRRLAQAIEQNPAIHDGATMVGRKRISDPYRVAGWSFRLFPAPAASEPQPNRGSAFDSCVSMSCIPTVDRLYLASELGAFRFESGSVVKLQSLANGLCMTRDR
jgi:hypothetical protein